VVSVHGSSGSGSYPLIPALTAQSVRFSADMAGNITGAFSEWEHALADELLAEVKCQEREIDQLLRAGPLEVLWQLCTPGLLIYTVPQADCSWDKRSSAAELERSSRERKAKSAPSAVGVHDGHPRRIAPDWSARVTFLVRR